MIVTGGFEDRYGSDPCQRFHLLQTVLQRGQSVGRMNDIETAAVRPSFVQEDLGFTYPFSNIDPNDWLDDNPLLYAYPSVGSPPASFLPA